MGFNVTAFHFILQNGFEVKWIITPLLWPTTASHISCCSLDAVGAFSLMEIFTLVPSTVSHYINFSLEFLVDTLWKLDDAQVHWPEGSEFDELSNLTTVQHPLLQGAFGTIDDLNLPIQTLNDDIENSTYNGWLHAHFVSSVFAFSAWCVYSILFLHFADTTIGLIIGCHLNAPGSWHDLCVARLIYENL
jgi:hypothetical protein